MKSTRDAKLTATGYEIAALNAAESGEMGFSSPFLISCTLPHSKPAESPFVRRVPWCKLMLSAPEPYGIPYGSAARLFLHHVQTEVVRTKEREVILAPTLSQAARRIGVGTDTRAVRRLKRQLLSCFTATWLAEVDEKAEEEGRRTKTLYRFQIASQVKFNYDPKQPDQVEIWEPRVRVSADFYRQLQDRSIPYDFRALKALARSPLGMDLYVWSCSVAPTLREPKLFPYWWFLEQWGTQYPNSKQGRKDFRKKLCREVKHVLRVWPELQVDQVEGGVLLHPAAPHVRRLSP